MGIILNQVTQVGVYKMYFIFVLLKVQGSAYLTKYGQSHLSKIEDDLTFSLVTSFSQNQTHLVTE